MLDELIERLRSPEREARSHATRELATLARSGTLTSEDAARLVRTAAGSAGDFPAATEFEDPTATLVWAARDIARDKNPEPLVEVTLGCYERLRPMARTGALQLLTMVATPPAADAYVHLIRTHGAPRAGPGLPSFEPSAGREVGARLLPALLELCRDWDVAFPTLCMFLEFIRAGAADPVVAGPFSGRLASALRGQLALARPMQRREGIGWRDDPAYSPHRAMIGLLMDLSGHLRADDLTAVVEQAGDLADPRPRRFRAVALLALGRDVPDAELEWIARSPRDRYWLAGQLPEDRAPAACRDQALLAEGHMVDWLCYGTELGREPDEIEPIRVETRSRSEAKLMVRWLAKRRLVDYYFFRFRVTEEHWAKEKGWMVGMAGGYARDEQPTVENDGGTFSQFEPFDSRTIDQHVEMYLG
jgi:hypothetical protein